MKAFAELYEKLDATTSTNSKIEAMAQYFRIAPSNDAAWALFFLTGRKLKRFISSRLLREWTLQLTQTPEWLFDESYSSVGDTAECCALLLDSLPRGEAIEEAQLSVWMNEKILPLFKQDPDEQRKAVTSWWAGLERSHIFTLNKILTGALRVGVSQSLVSRALAEVSGHPTTEIAHRLMGDWEPSGEWYEGIVSAEAHIGSISKPYPFFLASPLEKETTELGEPHEWQAEWKWDGIRAQLVRREGETFLWSRGEELITERFPEITQGSLTLPEGTVVDGEVLAFKDGQVMPFGILQKRIGRKTLSKNILKDAPAVLMAYDLLEHEGIDLRDRPLSERRALLEKLLVGRSSVVQISPSVQFSSWADLATQKESSRDRGVEGFMLKRKSSVYQGGRKRGDWWKWKIDPLTVDAVLIYAQAGSGRRANLFTDYTFAVWSGDTLLPVAKAYSGLDDQEIAELDNWIRRNTQDRFGPVRSVTPFHVFELAFEGINASPRHKSGIAVRFPRILRWRRDKKVRDADTIETLRAMIKDVVKEADENANSKEHDLRRDQALEEAR